VICHSAGHLPGTAGAGIDPYWRLVAAFLVGYPQHSSRAYFGDLKRISPSQGPGRFDGNDPLLEFVVEDLGAIVDHMSPTRGPRF
jgi:hypothetical protein